MSILGCILLLASLFASPEVIVSNEQGQEITGELQGLSSQEVSIKRDEKTELFPAATLMNLQFTSPKKLRGVTGSRIFTNSGDLLIARTFNVSGNKVSLDSPTVGQYALEINQVKSILFGKLDDQVSAKWNELTSRETRSDMLVIKKGNVLDFLNGVVGDISEETIKFLSDGREIPVKREKVFGIIYYRKTTNDQVLPVKINFTTGESIYSHSLQLKNEELQVELAPGAISNISYEAVKLIDFSKGKLVYVSDLTPVNEEYTPHAIGASDAIYKQLFEMKTDRHIYGESLKLGNRKFAKGLCLHSDTVVKYKINQQYKQLVGTVGIDPDSFNTHGNAQVTIKGDQQVLWEKEVKGIDEPMQILLDVRKYRELTLEVRAGSDGTDLGDNVIFGGLYLLRQE